MTVTIGIVTGRLLVVCKDDQTLDVIDLTSGAVEGRIRASGFTPHEVAATSDGLRAFMPIYSDAYLGDPGTDGRAIDVVDLVTMRVAHTIPLNFASRPHLPLMGGDGRLYVGTELDESISVVDPTSGERVGRLPTQRPQSHMFVLSPDGTRAYSANVDSGSVSIIDVASESVIDVVDVAAQVQRISISPDGTTVFTADQDQPRMAAIDVATTDITWIELPSRGFGSAVTPDGRLLVVALKWASQIGIVDLVELSVSVIAAPGHPQAIVIHPDGTHAYSACDDVNQVVEVDLRVGTVSRVFDTGECPDGICWAATPDRIEPR